MSNEIGTKKLSFNIQGEFITKLAREWFYSVKKSYDEVLEMLMDIMSSPDISEVQSRRYTDEESYRFDWSWRLSGRKRLGAFT